MIKIDENYSDYYDKTDSNYPEGKAINATTSDSYDGTPLLADLVNDIVGAHQAMYKKAYGDTSGISGNPDSVITSQFAEAVAKYSDDKLDAHDILRGENAHGATVAATPGQLIARDENGRAQVSAPIDDDDIVNKSHLDGELAEKSPLAGSENLTTFSKGTFGTAAAKDTGAAAGNVPEISEALGDAANVPLVTDGNNKVKPHGSGALGAAAFLTPETTASNTSTGIPTTGMAIASGNAGAICTTGISVQAKTVDINGFALFEGVTVKIMFKNGNSAALPTLNINNTGDKAIKAVRAGEKIDPVNHTGYWRGASATSLEMWQPYTILELMYDGTDWVIIGNPTVESYVASDGSSGYEVKADGLIIQHGYSSFGSRNGIYINYAIPYSNVAYSFVFTPASSGIDDAKRQLSPQTCYKTVEHIMIWQETALPSSQSWITYGY